jgi:hypothetical protein
MDGVTTVTAPGLGPESCAAMPSVPGDSIDGGAAPETRDAGTVRDALLDGRDAGAGRDGITALDGARVEQGGAGGAGGAAGAGGAVALAGAGGAGSTNATAGAGGSSSAGAGGGSGTRGSAGSSGKADAGSDGKAGGVVTTSKSSGCSCAQAGQRPASAFAPVSLLIMLSLTAGSLRRRRDRQRLMRR